MDDQEFQAVVHGLLVPLDEKGLAGPKRYIYCYLRADGDCPARRFLESLPKAAKASYATSMMRLCSGEHVRGEKHHLLDGKGCDGLGEFKHLESQTRLVHTTDERGVIVLLLGFGGKKEDKIKKVHINEAMALRDDFRVRKRAILERLAKVHLGTAARRTT